MTSQEYQRGDVFLIPISDSTMGIGQIADVLTQELYLVVFKETWSAANPPVAADVANCTPLFSSLSLDAKIWNGDWKVLGNCNENLGTIAIPMYKVNISGRMYLESYRGEGRRAATEDELRRLRYRKTVAPVRLEKALKATHGYGEWHTAFDELYYDYAKESSTYVL